MRSGREAMQITGNDIVLVDGKDIGIVRFVDASGMVTINLGGTDIRIPASERQERLQVLGSLQKHITKGYRGFHNLPQIAGG